MALTSIQQLRSLLGEDIPEGGSAADTLFSDLEIQSYIDSTPNLDRAAYEGYRVKAARLGNLVDTTEGNSQKKFSQARASAIEMMKVYSKASGGPTEGRTRIGRIKRDPLQW
jgi:hypothetical protein